MSLDHFKIIFHPEPLTLPASDITTELNKIRQKITPAFYAKLSSKNQLVLQRFMWEKLHYLWEMGSPQVRLAASSTVGQLLIHLSPNHAPDLLNTLEEAINKCKGSSLLYLSSYCYLSKFFTLDEIEEQLTHIELLHLFGIKDAKHFPGIVNELRHLPFSFLNTLAEYLLGIALEDITNVHIQGALRNLFSLNVEKFVPLLTIEIPIQLLANVLPPDPHKYPLFSEEIQQYFTAVCVDKIENKDTNAASFKAACIILKGLISTNQAPFDCVKGIFTKKNVGSVPSVEYLFTLPIDASIATSLYNENVQVEQEDDDMNDFEQFNSVNLFMSNNTFDNDSTSGVYDPTLMSPSIFNSNFLYKDETKMTRSPSLPSSFRQSIPYMPSIPLPELKIPRSKRPSQFLPPIPNSPLTALRPPSQFSDLDYTPVGDFNSSDDEETKIPAPSCIENLQPTEMEETKDKTRNHEDKTQNLADIESNFASTPNIETLNIDIMDSYLISQPEVKIRKSTSESEIIKHTIKVVSPKKEIHKQSPSIPQVETKKIPSSELAISLMHYFRDNPYFQTQLTKIITNSLNPELPEFECAIETIGIVAKDMSNETLNSLLYKVFNLKVTQPELLVMILQTISKIDLTHMSKVVGDKIVENIETAIQSKHVMLRKAAQNTLVKLSSETSTDLFKYIFDRFAQKLDVFNEFQFENRLEFLAYVGYNVPGQWKFSFLHILLYLKEALELLPLNRRVVISIFKYLEAFAPFSSNQEILWYFIKYAINIIEDSYNEFMGKPINLKIPKIFENNFPRIQALGRADPDLITNLGVCHTSIIDCGQAALGFISCLHWEDFNLKADSVLYLSTIALKCNNLLPAETNNLIIAMCQVKEFNYRYLPEFINHSTKVSKTGGAVPSLARLIHTAFTKFHIKLSTFPDIKEFIKLVRHFINWSEDLSYKQVMAIKDFLSLGKQGIDNETCLKLIISTQRKNFIKGIDPDDRTVKENQLFSNSSYNIEVEPNVMKGEEEDMNDDEEQLIEQSGVQRYITSMSPFIFTNIGIQPEFLNQVILISYCNFSHCKMNESQCKALIEYCLDNCNSRAFFFVLKYIMKMRIQLNLEPYLDHHLLQTRKFFTCVLAFFYYHAKNISELSPKCMEYIKRQIGDDLYAFVLNANDVTRKIANSFIKFDPEYFIDKFLLEDDFNDNQIMNLSIYSQISKFNQEKFYRLMQMILNKSKDVKRKNTVRRIIIAYAYCQSITKQTIPSNFFQIITEGRIVDITKISEHTVKKMSIAELYEIGYGGIAYIKNKPDADLTRLMNILTPSTPLGSELVAYTNTTLTNEQLASMLKSFIPSIRLIPFNYVTKRLRTEDTYNISESTLDLLLSIKPKPNSLTTEIIAQLIFFIGTKSNLGSIARKILNYIPKNFSCDPKSYQAIRFVPVYKQLSNGLPFCDQIGSVIEFLKPFTDKQHCSPQIFDLISSCCTKIRQNKIAAELYQKWLSRYRSYFTPQIMENAAVCSLSHVEGIKDVADVVPDSDYFYGVYFATVAVEKKNRTLPHDRLMDKYKGSYKLALQYVRDPRLRIFSPLFAFLKSDEPIPQSLKNYVESLADSVQRVHMTDVLHEF